MVGEATESEGKMDLKTLVDSIFSDQPDLGPRKIAVATIVVHFDLDPRRCDPVFK